MSQPTRDLDQTKLEELQGKVLGDVAGALGAQAGEKRLTEVLKEASFKRVRRATETPINMVLEAKP